MAYVSSSTLLTSSVKSDAWSMRRESKPLLWEIAGATRGPRTCSLSLSLALAGHASCASSPSLIGTIVLSGNSWELWTYPTARYMTRVSHHSARSTIHAQIHVFKSKEANNIGQPTNYKTARWSASHVVVIDKIVQRITRNPIKDLKKQQYSDYLNFKRKNIIFKKLA